MRKLRQTFFGYVVRNAVISGIKLKQGIETITDSSIISEAMTAYQSILQEGEAKGKLEGEAKSKLGGILRSLKRGKLTIFEISEDFDVTVEYVLKIKAEHGL